MEKDQIEELRERVENLEMEVEMLRSECDECENDLHWAELHCRKLEKDLDKKEEEILRLKNRYEDMNILWEPVYTFLQENRDRLDPVNIEEFLKSRL